MLFLSGSDYVIDGDGLVIQVSLNYTIFIHSISDKIR